jgi:hypothetical protein
MQFTTPEFTRPEDVEARLRMSAADADPLTAARGKKLLELVQ